MTDRQAAEPLTVAQRGRPRDPDTDRRIVDTAMQLYAESGWSGFSFDLIARRAGVGKNAIYRRWSDKGALLATLLEERWLSVEDIDTGSLRGDLTAFSRMLLDHYAGAFGSFGFQLHLDVMRHAEVEAATSDYRDSIKRAARNLVRAAIAREELPVSVAPTLILDVLAGSILSHVSATPPAMRAQMMAGADNFVANLVALVLEGVSGRPKD